MTRVVIDTRRIIDWDSFHNLFAEVFGFPGFYGRNMDAWIDCMTWLDDPESGMTRITVEKNDMLVLELQHVKDFMLRCPEQYAAIVECSAFVNYRRVEADDAPVIALSFFN
jgi:RNAse (barnase) inhibitor barstar